MLLAAVVVHLNLDSDRWNSVHGVENFELCAQQVERLLVFDSVVVEVTGGVLKWDPQVGTEPNGK